MNRAARTRQCVRAYLSEQTDGGTLYCKSKQIAAALTERRDSPLSAQEIGQAMGALSESASELVITRWGYTSATTWRVEQIEPAPSARSCSEASP